MKSYYISALILYLSLIAVIFIIDYSRQRQMDKIRNDFKDLLTVVNSLRFRVFDHENQLLERDGVYVPEDTGIFAFNLMWSILDDKTKNQVQEEYRQVCPSHIPLWKFVIYSYKFSPKFERKIEMKKIESVDDMLIGNLKEVSKAIDEFKTRTGEMHELKDKINSVSQEVNNVANVLDEDKK